MDQQIDYMTWFDVKEVFTSSTLFIIEAVAKMHSRKLKAVLPYQLHAIF